MGGLESVDIPVAGQADVLIVGAGPAGCMAAVTLSRYGVDFLIFDKRPVRTQTGHASAFQPRTQEILQTIGIRQKLDDLGHRLTETSFWTRRHDQALGKVSTGPEVVNPTPYQYMFNTDQGLTERTFEEELEKAGSKICRFTELVYYESTSHSEWPLRVHMKNHISGSNETWLAKYLLGADGSRSATRQAMGAKLIVNGQHDTWAVADLHIETNFPDRRRRCAIRTPDGGCMLIPRKEEGMRIFLQLTADQVSQLDACNAMSRDRRIPSVRHTESFQLLNIVETQAQIVLHPYHIKFTDVIWLSRYMVAQRLVDKFADDSGRVILLGDSCHTHSPKAGQGMNVSISDAYNLTWKLALVLRGAAGRNILDTYQLERRQIAEQLIAFDTKFARLFGEKENLDSKELEDLWEQNHGFTSGCAYKYPCSILVDNNIPASVDTAAPEPLIPGKRILDIPLRRHIDGTLTTLLDDMPSNGRFHVFFLVGRLLESASFAETARDLDCYLGPLGPFNDFSKRTFHHEDITTLPPRANAGVKVDLFLIHTKDHSTTDLGQLPSPFNTTWQSRVYEDEGGFGHHKWGINQDQGCLALVRPDGYVSCVTSVSEAQSIYIFLCRIFGAGDRENLQPSVD